MKTKNLPPYQLIGFTASNPESWFVVNSSDLQSRGVLFFTHVRKLGLDFQLETDASMDRQFKEKAAQLIAIEDIPALSKLTSKRTAQQSGHKSAKYCNKVTGSLKNLS